MAKPLVIVESPAKARTIAGYLGDDFRVESSVGHVRDLPSKGLGVDIDNGFKVTYEVNPDKRDVLKRLRQALGDADLVYLATDEDREGEAISWHLVDELKPRVPVRRMVFHEITPDAIRRAVEEWREIDYGLVDAQETRRIVDRLYGYPVSGVLWRKVNSGLSAGRVQSPALRLVVERERQRLRFVSASYWDLTATFRSEGDDELGAGLVAIDGRRIADGKRDFGEDGQVKSPDVVVLDQESAEALVAALDGATGTVHSVETKPYRRSPRPPFITSTFQQEAGRKLGMSARQAMAAAQGLYEGGYITYMRTDSTTLSETALAAARRVVVERYGRDLVPPTPRTYTRKVRNAQEAHEAIRPAGDSFRHPADVAREVPAAQARAYELIWQRTVASQMVDAVGETVTIRIRVPASDGREADFSASGTVITVAGYQAVYEESRDEGDDGERRQRLPSLSEGDRLSLLEVAAAGHSTQPPARYTEASLVKALEDLGIGRPSTYASIIDTIKARYVWKRGSALVPSWTAFAVVNLLERHFQDLVDYGFTARMEDDLDDIANGQKERVPWLTHFWFGNGQPGLQQLVSDEHLAQIDAAEVNTFHLGFDPDGQEIVVKPGKFGPYVKRGDDTAGLPEDLPPDELTVERALELLSAPREGRLLGHDPDTGEAVFAKAGRFGPYVQLGEPEEGSKQKLRTASLFASMSLETVSLEDALRLLSQPRVVGVDPADGLEITAQNGKFGPYLKKGKETRSLDAEEQIFGVSLDEALRLLAEPKRRGRQAKPPLRELGEDPASGKPVVVKEGRFGPYVTDGETNASLRTGDAVETITIDRAAELLAERRAKGPAKKKARSGKPPKRAGAKKTGAKKTPAEKTAAKKAGAEKTATKKAGGKAKKAG